MPSAALVTFGGIVLAVFFFFTPLVLKYHVYRPVIKHVMSGDVVPISGRLSSVWCQGVDIQSEAQFKSYIYDQEPTVDEDSLETTVSTHHMVLPNLSKEYWGFHLLRGSRLNLSTCARLIRADVTVVKGTDGLKQCLKEHKKKADGKDTSGEDSLSLSESDEDTSSISSSQGVVTNETDAPYICTNSLAHIELPTSYTCKFPFSGVSRQLTLSQEIDATDYYYYIFSSNSYLDILPNEFSILFSIDRTHYNYSGSLSNCPNGYKCHLPIAMGSRRWIVMQMQASNGTLKKESLLVACKPRESIFMGFYTMFFIVVFLCALQ